MSLNLALEVPPTTADLTGVLKTLYKNQSDKLDREIEFHRLDALSHYVQVALLQNLFRMQTKKRDQTTEEGRKIHDYLAPSFNETLSRAKSILASDLRKDWMDTVDHLPLLNSSAKVGRNLEYKAGFSVESLVTFLGHLEVAHVEFLSLLEKSKGNRKVSQKPGFDVFYRRVKSDSSYDQFEELRAIIGIFLEADHLPPNLFIMSHAFAREHFKKVNSDRDELAALKVKPVIKKTAKAKKKASAIVVAVASEPPVSADLPVSVSTDFQAIPQVVIQEVQQPVGQAAAEEYQDEESEEEVETFMTEEDAVKAMKRLFFKYAQEKKDKIKLVEEKTERPEWLEKIVGKFSHNQYKLEFMQFFDDRQIHESFKFERIKAMVDRVGGKIIFNKSSHCEIVMPNRGFGHSWRSHGKGKERPLSTLAVKRFRDAFISAGITPETLGFNE